MSQLILRQICLADARVVSSWRRDPDVIRFYSGHPYIVTQQDEEEWISNVRNCNDTKVFIVEVNNEPAGLLTLRNIQWIHRSVELSLLVAPGYRSMGVGRRAVSAALKCAFQDLGVKRAWLRVHQSNAAAVRLYKSAGFRVEGTMRQSWYSDGRFTDQLLMAILDEEFTEKAE
jgi:diamine N-acetyltransferase